MTEPNHPTQSYAGPPQPGDGYAPPNEPYGGYYSTPAAESYSGYYGPPPAAAPPPRPARSGPGRLVLITLLVCAGAFLAGAGVPAVWSRSTLLSSDRFVTTLAPLASDAGVQHLVISTVSTRIESSLGSAGGPLSGAVTTVVTRVVTGPQFPGLWRSICRVAHPGVVAVLTGQDGVAYPLSSARGQLTLDVGPVIAYIQGQLVQAGVPVSGLPTSGVLVTVSDVPQLSSLQRLIRFVDSIAWWLIGFAVVAFALAIAIARGRLRVVTVSGVLLAIAMLVDLLIVSGVRATAVDQAAGFLGSSTAGATFDTIVHSLRADLVTILIVALVLAAAALVLELVTRSRART